MEVVKKGPTWETWSLEKKCHECESVLSIEASDLHYTYEVLGSVWTSTWRNYYYYVVCPECSSRLTIKKSSIPSVITDQIQLS